MKKNYEKPVLTTEPFDVEDVITVSDAAGPEQTNGLEHGRGIWEIPLGL